MSGGIKYIRVYCKYHHYYLPSELFPSFQTGTPTYVLIITPIPLTLFYVCTYFTMISPDSCLCGDCFIFRVEEAGLINHPPWKLKVIQLSSSQRVLHGMMTPRAKWSREDTCIRHPDESHDW